jgi:hypothetical protein
VARRQPPLTASSLLFFVRRPPLPDERKREQAQLLALDIAIFHSCPALGAVERRRPLADAQARQHRPTAGLYTVGFQHDVRNCAVAATAGLKGTTATVNDNASNPRTVTVGLSEARLNSARTFVEDIGVESAFNVIAQC